MSLDKRISIVSDSTNTPVNSKHLLELFNKIIKEYIFDLSIVQKPFIDQVFFFSLIFLI